MLLVQLSSSSFACAFLWAQAFLELRGLAHICCCVVAKEGPDVLYTGRFAAKLAADIQAAGGYHLVWSASCSVVHLAGVD